MKEQNYDFRRRHWEYHRKGMRNPERQPADNEVMLNAAWRLSYQVEAEELVHIATRDFRDYLEVSQGLSIAIDGTAIARQFELRLAPLAERCFTLDVSRERIVLTASDAAMLLRAVVHIEDIMNLEGAPVLPLGHLERHPIYRRREVHSGCGIDEYPDEELMALIHAGYDAIAVMVKEFDVTAAGPCNLNDIIRRAKRLGLEVAIFNYLKSFKHPDDSDAEAFFDSIYGELFRRYPDADAIGLCGESLEFPSKDPATTGKRYRDSVVDGIPDTRPSPGWYPCSDYPAFIQAIEKAVHKVKPTAEVSFSTYNWGYQPFELRRQFLANFPKRVSISITFEIFSQRTLEGLHTPVMDYTISAQDPGYYFTSECAEAHRLGIPIQGNVNTAGVCWDFGCVPYVPVPQRWYRRSQHLRKAQAEWGVNAHYATHHYGWWNCVAADIGKWASWREINPECDELLAKIAMRDYGKEAAPFVLEAWAVLSEAMDHYIASNEDQYGPWRVGAAYPFIFQPNISRTMMNKEIQFPTAPRAHFGHRIIKTFYTPYENADQTPGFLRYPAELRSLEKMLELWNKGLNLVEQGRAVVAPAKADEMERLCALVHFIRNSIVTTIHIKQWWRENIAMLACDNATDAEKHLDFIEAIAYEEIRNAEDTIPCVEADSRLGWEASMEYVCDRWHLEWKIRQVNAALREIAAYRKMLHL